MKASEAVCSSKDMKVDPDLSSIPLELLERLRVFEGVLSLARQVLQLLAPCQDLVTPGINTARGNNSSTDVMSR